MFTLAFTLLVLGLLTVVLPIVLNAYLPLWHQRGYRRGISKAVHAEAQRLNLGAQRLLDFLSLKAVF